MPLQHYVNHISLVVDKSSSMLSHSKRVVEVFDRELAYLKQRSIDLNQETRISIYLFSDKTEILTFDMDVMRFNSLQGYYSPLGNTALLDAVAKSIEDNKKLPEIFGDHAFLQYVITDGQENRSQFQNVESLQTLLENLPDNWTNAVLVPDQYSVKTAQSFGFNLGSIAVWDTSKVNALDGIGKQFSATVDNYMAMRASGVRGTKSLFTLDSTQLNKVAPTKLQEIPQTSFDIFPVTKDAPIREYINSLMKAPYHYRLGSAYYQATKPVVIQEYKDILVQNVNTGKVYNGASLRTLLGLPSDTVSVAPGDHTDWNIFIQSTSVNRKLFAGTQVLVQK